MHAQTGIHEAHQDVGSHGKRRRITREEGGRGAVFAKRDTIKEEIQRRIVDGRGIAGVEHAERGSGIATHARLAGPHCGFAETRGVDRGTDRGVLHRVDFTEEQRDIGIVGDAGIRCACNGPSAYRRGRFGDHHHSVEPHGALDGRVRARLKQVRAGPGSRPGVLPFENVRRFLRLMVRS